MAWVLVGLSLTFCFGDRDSDCPPLPPVVENVGPAKWEAGGRAPRLIPERAITLDSGGDGFVTKLRWMNVAYEGGRFYVADAVRGAGIAVYDSTGAYLRTVSSPFTSPIRGLIVERDGFWVKSDAEGAIVRLDTLGQELRRVATPRGLEQGDPVIIVGGLGVVEEGDRFRVYTTVFEDRGLDTYPKGRWVASFDAEGEVQDLFGCADPLYYQLYLPTLLWYDFTIVEDRLYLIEGALPQVRVFSLEGRALAVFAGGGGANFHQAYANLPQDATYARIDSLSILKTFTYGVERIHVSGYQAPVIGLAYQNRLESWLAAHPRSDNHTRHYLTLYSTDGDVLVRELPLPGRLLYASRAGQLVVNLDDTPDHRRFGIYRIALDAGS